MGEIVGAALVSHVPPLVLPEEIRRELNDGDDTTLFQGLHDLRAEKLAPLNADTVVVIDTHWFTTIEHIVASHERRSGLYTSEELPRGMAQMPYDMPGDPELAHAWADMATDREDTWITPIDDPHLPVHYPTINIACRGSCIGRPSRRGTRQRRAKSSVLAALRDAQARGRRS